MEKLWPIHSEGAMESFTEALNKLKELHEKEVIGLQTKLAELTMEKCRDAQRIEELFSKNHILREQQKALNENVKVLENRLRAGLCDRCTVTQEIAKKKQQEFESTHFQSLQHISSLTNEINGLKEDNKSLLDELNVLKNPQERIKAQSGPTQENRSNPNSPLPLASPVSRTKSLDRVPSREYEGREEASYSQLAEEKSGPRSSPRSRMSPVTDGRLYEMNPQRISNQLHGTIAVMRPGSRSCQQEKGSDGQTEAPSKVPTPTYLSDGNMTSNCHNNANATPNYHNDADMHDREAAEAASHHEALQHGSRREHLYRLGQQITQHRTGLRSHAISMDSMGRYTCHVPKARAAELGRKQSKDDWDERMPLVGRVVYLSEKDLRGRLSVLEQRERLQYFRVRKQQQLQWTRQELKNSQFLSGVYRDIQDGQPEQGERVHNKSLAETYHEKLARQVKQSEREQFIEHKKDALSSSDTLDLKERGLSFKNSKNPEPTDNEWPQQSFPPDKPLDLSDYGRGRDSSGSLEDICNTLGQPVLNNQTTESKTGYSPSNILHSKDNNQRSRSSSPVTAGNQMQRDNDSDHRNENNDGSSLDWKSSPQGHDVGDSAVCAREETSGIRLRLSVRRPNPDLETQPDDDDGESIKRESDEVESTDSETTVRYDTGDSMKDKIQGSMKKRKRGHDPWTKAHRRFSKGRKKGKALQTPPEAEAMEKNTSSSSDVFGGT